MASRSSVNVSYLRTLNQRRILDTIERCEVTSRTELAQSLSMSKPAISDNLAKLIEMGLVEEERDDVSAAGSGRKPILLRFNKNNKYIIAIDLNNTNLLFVMTNLKYEIIQEFEIKISSSASVEAYLPILFNGISLLMNSSGCPKDSILCIAVASPGVFNEQSELCAYNAKGSGAYWCQIDLKKVLSERFSLPVIIRNDIKAATLGEWCMGTSCENDDMMYIGCGIGLGIGIVLGGQLYESQRHNAGEIYNYTDRDKLRQGLTLESTTCMEPLIERVKRGIEAGNVSMLSDRVDSIGFPDIVEAYKAKDPYIIELICDVADDINILIFNTVNLLSIETVVLGGDYIVFSETIFEEFEKKFKPLCHYPPRLILPGMGKYSGVVGMAYLAKKCYLDDICNAD